MSLAPITNLNIFANMFLGESTKFTHAEIDAEFNCKFYYVLANTFFDGVIQSPSIKQFHLET